jgi:hypothetical protein
MTRVIALLTALVALPAFADEYTLPAASSPATQPAAAAPAAAAPAAATGTVARAQFTSAVENREPVDKVTNLINDKTEIYFFSELKNLDNHKVTHRWEHEGKTAFEKSFDVGGNRWRVFSGVTLDPAQTGEWKVSVVDENGATIDTASLSYQAAPAAEPAATAPPAASAPAPAAR